MKIKDIEELLKKGYTHFVEGELDVLCNGMPSSVTIRIACKTEEEALQVKTERIGCYNRLKIQELKLPNQEIKNNS